MPSLACPRAGDDAMHLFLGIPGKSEAVDNPSKVGFQRQENGTFSFHLPSPLLRRQRCAQCRSRSTVHFFGRPSTSAFCLSQVHVSRPWCHVVFLPGHWGRPIRTVVRRPDPSDTTPAKSGRRGGVSRGGSASIGIAKQQTSRGIRFEAQARGSEMFHASWKHSNHVPGSW